MGGHRTTGFYRFFELARVYEGWQRLMIGTPARARLVQQYFHVSPGDRVLDMGCATGWILEFLPPGVDYVGYDLNPRYIARAVERHGDRGRFFQGSVGSDQALESSFDMVIASAILHHLDDPQAINLVDRAHTLLRAAGVLVTIDACLHPGQSPVARLLISLDRGRHIRTPEAYGALLSRRFPQVETRLVTDLLRVPYSHFVARARKD